MGRAGNQLIPFPPVETPHLHVIWQVFLRVEKLSLANVFLTVKTDFTLFSSGVGSSHFPDIFVLES